MKKFTIIILWLSLMLTACKKSDSTFSRQVPGNWTRDRSGTMFIGSDGSWSIKPSSDSLTNSYAGTWQIKDHVFIMTFTNDPMKGGIARYTIIRVDDHQLVYEDSGNIHTNSR
jgi:hypothetical protein